MQIINYIHTNNLCKLLITFIPIKHKNIFEMLWFVKFIITTSIIFLVLFFLWLFSTLLYLSAAWVYRSVPRLIQTPLFVFPRSSQRTTSSLSFNSWPHIMLDNVNICFVLSKVGQLRSSDNWCYNDIFTCMFTTLAVKFGIELGRSEC
jgi:hypothetical protein